MRRTDIMVWAESQTPSRLVKNKLAAQAQRSNAQDLRSVVCFENAEPARRVCVRDSRLLWQSVDCRARQIPQQHASAVT